MQFLTSSEKKLLIFLSLIIFSGITLDFYTTKISSRNITLFNNYIAKKSTAYNPVNVNTATIEELSTLPGIGEAIAQRIIYYRQANGPIKNPENLINVKGIGRKKLQKIKDLVTVG